MLDAKIDSIFSANVAFDGKVDTKKNALLIRACKVCLFSKERVYSQLNELTFDILNYNNGLGTLDVEFVFDNKVVPKRYPVFYTKCFVIRTDTGVLIKPMKRMNKPAYSKVDQDGNVVVGIRYYFNCEEEIEKIMQCNKILVEGFIALENPKNVFGVMCQMKKIVNSWEITEAYTYKHRYAKNIKYLMD